ncbi:unnamed protein product [Larinioides sclopetarius]|uniref:Uncharacterized protein n=1 Tax=Larinioides sclopetarius TaxID=280406 RepID=A0AAV1YQV5_9ARAC
MTNTKAKCWQDINLSAWLGQCDEEQTKSVVFVSSNKCRRIIAELVPQVSMHPKLTSRSYCSDLDLEVSVCLLISFEHVSRAFGNECSNSLFVAPVSSEQLFCTTKRESSSELALNPYFQSKGCMCPIMHTPRSQEILYFKLPPKNQVLDEDCATDESFHDSENTYIGGLSSSFFNFKTTNRNQPIDVKVSTSVLEARKHVANVSRNSLVD